MYPSVQLKESKVKEARDVFILFSAMNALGYDDENNPKGMSPARRKMRSVLLQYNWDEKYPHLKYAIGKFHAWHLLRMIVLRKNTTKRISIQDRFIVEFKKFSKEPQIQRMWKTFKMYQVKETRRLANLFEREAKKLIEFTGGPSEKVKKLILITNPLDSYWRGYALFVKGAGYIVVGPGAGKNRGELIRHELLHILAPSFRIPQHLTSCRNYRQLDTMGYGSRSFINREYVIRSLNLLYESEVLKKNITDAIKREGKHFPNIKKTMEFVKKMIKKGRQ